MSYLQRKGYKGICLRDINIRMNCVVKSVNVNPEGGVPKYPVNCIELTATGVVGDKQRYKNHGGTERAVLLFDYSVIQKLQSEGHTVDIGTTGENITFVNDDDTFQPEESDIYQIGSTIFIQLTFPAPPCGTIADSFIDGDINQVSDEVNPGQARWCASVLVAGKVYPNDRMRLYRRGSDLSTLEKENYKFLAEHPLFCPYFYSHLEIRAGTTLDSNDELTYFTAKSLCCSTVGSFGPNKVKTYRSDTSLAAILLDKPWQKIRKEIARGKIPEACLPICYDKLTTDKRWSTIEYFVNLFSFADSVEAPSVQIIDYKFGNECNLACRMCTPGSSNTILKNTLAYIEQQPDDQRVDTVQQINHFGNFYIRPGDLANPNWLEATMQASTTISSPQDVLNIKRALPTLQHLQLAGGEPFVSNNVEEVLLAAIESGDNEHINLEITTNGTRFVRDKLDIFFKFRKLEFIISIDGTNKIYDYVRHPFKFNILEKRLQEFSDYIDEYNFHDKVDVSFCTVGLIYNLFDYENIHNLFMKYFQHLGQANSFQLQTFVYAMIPSPYVPPGANENMSVLSLDFLPLHIVEMALRSFTNAHSIEWHTELIEYVDTRVRNGRRESSYRCLQELKKHTLLTDKINGVDYHNYLHPVIIKLLDTINIEPS